MKRLINATTILSLALYVVPPFAAYAQDLPKVVVDGKEVICLPNKKTACPDGAFCVVVKNLKNCEARAAEALAVAAAGTPAPDQAAADQAAADQAAADKAAADQAAADQAAADKAAADQAAADKAAADQAAADKAAADQDAADKAAADQAAADKAAADKAAADQAAADQAAADRAAADQAAADKAAADQAAAANAAADQAAAEKSAADQAEADKVAAEAAAAAAAVAAATSPSDTATAVVTDLLTVTVGDKVFVCLPDATVACPDGAMCVIAKTKKRCDLKAAQKLADLEAAAAAAVDETTSAPSTTPAPSPEDEAALAAAQAAADAAAAAAAADPAAVIVEAPVPTPEAVTNLETALDQPANPDETVTAPPVAAANPEPIAAGTMPADAPAPANATVTTETVTAADTRASTQEFAAAPVTVAPGKKTGLTDFEKVGLVALGGLVIGAILKGNRQVVQNTGDRVVVRQPDGTYQVYKDDNALLREAGSTVKTETYRDGSTRTIVTRVDGSQIVTIRDATGRVLQRVAYDTAGRGTVLIDDLQPERAVDVTTLPKPRPQRSQIVLDDTDALLRAQLAAADAEDLGRKFSLRQIRTIPQVRFLAATIDVNNITFESGSSAIQSTEARKLNALGKLMTQLIDENPGEIFLVEGHTDAVGSAASNLSLSDRRAESVAKALTEYFGVPPENLVVQGYGESELKIDTQGNERANRRVAVRIITPLLSQIAN
jgi:outer membrane protein OmpA-like peptidoglycan-associated protein